MQEEGLKVLKAEVTNFKNITHKTIEFDGKSAMVLGKNGAGKSSLLQALTCAINSNMIPSKAIKDGEETASTLLKVGGVLDGEYQEFNIDMYFSGANQRGKLVISDKDGGKIPGGKKMVESIVGNVGFNILEFIDLGLTKDGKVSEPGVRQQIEVLKQFLPVEVQKLLMDLDSEKKEVFSFRAEINKDIKSNEAKLKNSEMDPSDIEKYSEKLDNTKTVEAMAKIGEDVSKYDQVVNAVETKVLKLNAIDEEVIRLNNLVGNLLKEREEVFDAVTKCNAWIVKKGERPSMGSLQEELETIGKHNEMHTKVVELKGFSESVRMLTVDSEGKTERLKQIDISKKNVFVENPLPVKGLSFDENEILYKGLPFNENQHPSSTIIGIGLTIAMAMNPNLRLLIIKDGSLLDQKTLNYILTLVEGKGYQVFIEMVDNTGESDVTINFIETTEK